MVGKGEGEASQEKGMRLLREFFCTTKGLISCKVSVLVIYFCVTHHPRNWWHETVPVILLLVVVVVVVVFQSISITGFPWWHGGKESACQCRKYGFDPWAEKIP